MLSSFQKLESLRACKSKFVQGAWRLERIQVFLHGSTISECTRPPAMQMMVSCSTTFMMTLTYLSFCCLPSFTSGFGGAMPPRHPILGRSAHSGSSSTFLSGWASSQRESRGAGVLSMIDGSIEGLRPSAARILADELGGVVQLGGGGCWCPGCVGTSVTSALMSSTRGNRGDDGGEKQVQGDGQDDKEVGNPNIETFSSSPPIDPHSTKY